MTVAPDPSGLYAYVGSTMTKDLFESSYVPNASVGAATTSSCKIKSVIAVKNPSGVYIDENDSYFGRIIKSYTAASGDVDKFNIVVLPVI
jgi:hypothetical protein